MFNLGKYLGMTIFHHKTGQRTFSFIIDKVRDRLNGWDVCKLSFTGRLTLVKSVLLSILNFFMVTARLSVTTCKEIEKIARKFLWRFSGDVENVTIVRWTDLCRPLERVGFSIRLLKDQNLLFFLKLGFKLVTDADALWLKILRNKYNIHGIVPDSLVRNNYSHT